MDDLLSLISLDFRTLLINLTVVAVTMATGMLAFWRVYGQSAAWRYWAAAMLAVVPGVICLLLAGRVTDLISTVLGNALLIFGVSVVWNGVRVFGDRPPLIWPGVALVVLSALLLVWFRWGDDDLAVRVIVIAFAQAAGLGACAVESWRNGAGRRHKLDRAAAVLFGILALVILSRGFLTSFDPDHDHLTVGPLRQVQLLVITIDVMLLVLCFLGLTSDRLVERLEETAARAERASEAKSRFLAMMSHEIRTPMTGVVGTADLLMSLDRDPERMAHLATLRASAGALMTLLDDILDFSRVEAGKLSIAAVATDVGAVLEEVRALFLPAAQEKGLSILLEMQPEVPRVVRVDPVRLRQVLLNLTGNALKFTEHGRITLGLTCELDREGPQLVFEVADTGIGMDEQQVSRLFQPFEQADASVGRRYGGSGLGLAICRGLAAAMGGRLEVESVVGIGSLFRLRLPAEGKAELLSAAVPGASEKSGIPDRTVTPARILLADDEPTNRRLIATVLRRMGHSVEEREDGPDTVEAVRTATDFGGGFDLLLLDMRMPKMDGPATAAAIRQLPGGAALRIVGLSADAMLAERERYLAAGLDAYLTKPVDWTALEREIDRALGDAQADAAAGGAVPPAPDSEASPPIRHTMLEELGQQLGADALGRTIELFDASLTRHLDRITRAAREQDRAGLQESAHALKGAAASLGADRLVSVLVRLEGSPTLQQAEACMPELTAEAAAARAALKAFRAGSGLASARAG